MESIEQQIAAFIANKILFSNHGYNYPYEASFLEEGIVDSTSILELVFFTENTFGFSVDDSEITPDNFDSVTKLADFVRSKAIPVSVY
jgi:acyl carrier protein